MRVRFHGLRVRRKNVTALPAPHRRGFERLYLKEIPHRNAVGMSKMSRYSVRSNDKYILFTRRVQQVNLIRFFSGEGGRTYRNTDYNWRCCDVCATTQ